MGFRYRIIEPEDVDEKPYYSVGSWAPGNVWEEVAVFSRSGETDAQELVHYLNGGN
jgi:hypothetical protein